MFGNVTFSASATNNVTLSGPNPAVDYAQLAVSGTLNLNNAVLKLTLSAAPLPWALLAGILGAVLVLGLAAGGLAVRVVLRAPLLVVHLD